MLFRSFKEGEVLSQSPGSRGFRPAGEGVAFLAPHQFCHDEFPIAGGAGGFVARGDEVIGLSLVAGVEGLLLLGLEILDVVGALTTPKDPVALFHLDSHGFEDDRRPETP